MRGRSLVSTILRRLFLAVPPCFFNTLNVWTRLCLVFCMLSAYTLAEQQRGVGMKDIGLPDYLVENDLGTSVAELEKKGLLLEAEAQLRAAIAVGDASPPAQGDRQNDVSFSHVAREIERLRRLRREFSLTREVMLEKIRSYIPDATLDDIDRWTREGVLQAVQIDGQVRWFRREPANLFRFSIEAQKWRSGLNSALQKTLSSAGDPSDRSVPAFNLNDHIRHVISRASLTGSSLPQWTKVHVTHTVRVLPGRVPRGARVRCWLPVPCNTLFQRNFQILSSSPSNYVLAAPDAPQRTIYFDSIANDVGETSFSVTYCFDTAAWTPLLTHPGSEELLDTTVSEHDLSEIPPHIVFTPYVRELVQSIVGDERDPLERARLIFEWVITHIRYASEMEYAVMPRIVEKALATRCGDCGVQALLFITLCRAAGIPARWSSGWVLYPSGWNMHDWAEFYVAPLGWLPADPSRGYRDVEEEDVRTFFFGNCDAYRMVANRALGSTFDPPKTFWRSDPVDNQRGELEWDGGNLYFDDWEYDVKISTTPLVDKEL